MNLNEKAVSKKQQQLFGIVHAVQKGELSPSKVTPDARKMTKTMKKKDVKDFAETKHKDLPTKKESMTPSEKYKYLSEALEEDYQSFFRRKLAASGHDTLDDMQDGEKARFFDMIDAKWKSKEEDLLGED